ncbi:cell wall surface anchor family protein [Streptococcus sp. DD11]|nr:cell wall surface anchor family protein [Streptococcus sp. DD11]
MIHEKEFYSLSLSTSASLSESISLSELVSVSQSESARLSASVSLSTSQSTSESLSLSTSARQSELDLLAKGQLPQTGEVESKASILALGLGALGLAFKRRKKKGDSEE